MEKVRRSNILDEREIEKLKEYARTHTRAECADYFNIKPNTVYQILRERYNLCCQWGAAITDDEWETMRNLICVGYSVSSVVEEYGNGRGRRYIEDGLISRFGADYKYGSVSDGK